MSRFKVVGLDTETTGMDPEKGHKIIEFCAQGYSTPDGYIWNPESGLTATFRINPLRQIDKAAEAVHGISLLMLKDEPEFSVVAPRIFQILNDADLLVIHNAAFDVSFIYAELAAVGLEMPDKPIYDTMTEGRHTTAMGKVPNLGEFCFAHGVSYDPDAAHAADYDTNCMMRGFFVGLRTGYIAVPSLDEFRLGIAA